MKKTVKRVPCFGKINLSLRVTGTLPHGWHELCSLFFKIGPFDYLTITGGVDDNVKVIYPRSKSAIQGRNILLKALEAARAQDAEIPRLHMTLEKNVPPGTGLGCGSGDAAALLSVLAAAGYACVDAARRTGADVPFLQGGANLALVRGVGEQVEPLAETPDWACAVVIPSWRCLTPAMYQKLDAHFADAWPLGADAACDEARELLPRLLGGRPCGLLPNDFASVLLEERPEYRDLFDEFAARGAFAWGISGSGSSAFALWGKARFSGFRSEMPWVEDTFIFS